MRFLLWEMVGIFLFAAAPVAQAQPLPPPARVALLKPFALSEASLSETSLSFRETTPHRVRLDTAAASARVRDRWLAPDKAKHATASFFLVLGGQYVFEDKAGLRRDPALALSLGTGAAVGLGKELYDGLRGATRDFSAKDLVADGVGLLLAAGLVLL